MILYIVCVQAATSRRELYVYVDSGPMTVKLHEECFANLKDIYRKKDRVWYKAIPIPYHRVRVEKYSAYRRTSLH